MSQPVIRNSAAEPQPLVLEGRVSIEAALRAGVRPVHEILATQPGDRRLAQLRRLAGEGAVPIRRVAPGELRRHATGQSHGGVIALVGERGFSTFDELLAGAPDHPFLVMLDGVEDPFNHGQAIRALYAAGADGLLVRPRTWAAATAVVTRSSAGASELLPAAEVANPDEAASLARRAGLTVACATTRTDATWLDDANLRGPILVVIGGERRGVSRSFLDDADLRLRIPYGRRGAHALGVSTAAALIAFEVLRQRRTGDGPALAGVATAGRLPPRSAGGDRGDAGRRHAAPTR